jgi:metacaspase-1
MKKYIFSLFILLFISIQAHTQTKRALFIAIGNYEEGKGWSKLNSMNDVELMKGILISQGFAENNITVLSDEQATSKGILQGINAFKDSLKTNDIAYIQISSHGNQLADNNEDEADGLDEAIVCYGAINPKQQQPASKEEFDKMAESYLRDDDLGKNIYEIRKKLGPLGDLLVIIDACHSGSGTRGGYDDEAILRGGTTALIPPGWNFNVDVNQTESEYQETALDLNDPALAPYVIISAAQASQLDKETKVNGKYVGGLSFGAAVAFQQKIGTPTYRSLFARIKTAITHQLKDQVPQLEGNGIDREIFGGQFVPQSPYLNITEIDEIKKIVKLDHGLLAGLQVGSEVSIYPSGTTSKQTATKLFTGRVIDVEAFSSTVQLDGNIKGNPNAFWAFVEKSKYNYQPLTFGFIDETFRGKNENKLGFKKAEKDKIIKNIAELGAVYQVKSPELIFEKRNDSLAIYIALTGYIYKTVSLAGLPYALELYNKYRFLSELAIDDEFIQVDMQMILLNSMKKEDSILTQSRLVNGNLELIEGDQVKFYVKNNSEKTLYYNMVDIQPDGIYAVLYTRANGYYAEDLFLHPGESKSIATLKIGPPYGLETFKVFFTYSMIELETTIGTNKMLNWDADPMELFYSNATESGSRGAIIPVGSGAVKDFCFKIKKKQE